MRTQGQRLPFSLYSCKLQNTFQTALYSYMKAWKHNEALEFWSLGNTTVQSGVLHHFPVMSLVWNYLQVGIQCEEEGGTVSYEHTDKNTLTWEVSDWYFSLGLWLRHLVDMALISTKNEIIFSKAEPYSQEVVTSTLLYLQYIIIVNLDPDCP